MGPDTLPLNILNALPISVVVIDPDYNIVFANEFARVSSGPGFPEPVSPLKCYQLSHHRDTPCNGIEHTCPHRTVMQTKESVRVSHIHFDDEGNRSFVEITAVPIFGNDGGITHVVEVTRDITKQVRAESALESVFMGTATEIGTHFFRSLVSNLAAVLDVAYAMVGELVSPNRIRTLAVWTGQGFAKNFEYDLEGTPCKDVLSSGVCSFPKDVSTLFPNDTMLADMGAVSYIGVPLEDSDGQRNGLLAVLDTAPLKDEKLNRKLVKIFAARAGAELGRKLAEQKQEKLEARFRQAQKTKAIGTLAGGIAHDFNNILSGILGFAQLALTHIHDPDRVAQDIQRIMMGAEKAADLVQQILTFSRETKQEETRPVDMAAIAGDALKLIRSTLPTYIEIHENLLQVPPVLGNPTNIHQVIMNLCTNAFLAMKESGGAMTVTLDNCTVESGVDVSGFDVAPGAYVRLKVEDTGCGIPKDKIHKIFDPYFTTRAPDQGTGLGLAVVSGIVKSHKGFIRLDSREGKGTCFQVFFPIAGTGKALAAPREKAAAVPTGTEHLLLVDDEPVILDALGGYLEERGYRVTTCGDGHEALETFEKTPDQFHMVITDMTMPGLTGDQLSRRILTLRPDMPIILCTGYSHKITRQKALDMGIRAFEEKPVLFSRLAGRIRALLDKSTLL